MSYITTYCRIKNNSYSVNENVAFTGGENDFESFVGEVYRKLDISYPKFHKMDLLAKTAFLGSEILIDNNQNIKVFDDQEVGLFFANTESSAYSDNKFYQSYTQDKPSPSQFVYTLPNILIGEIAIRNKWYGENLFLVLPEFNENEFSEHIHLLLKDNCKAVLCGWVNVVKDEIDAFFFIVEKKAIDSLELSVENLLKLYKI